MSPYLLSHLPAVRGLLGLGATGPKGAGPVSSVSKPRSFFLCLLRCLIFWSAASISRSASSAFSLFLPCHQSNSFIPRVTVPPRIAPTKAPVGPKNIPIDAPCKAPVPISIPIDANEAASCPPISTSANPDSLLTHSLSLFPYIVIPRAKEPIIPFFKFLTGD